MSSVTRPCHLHHPHNNPYCSNLIQTCPTDECGEALAGVDAALEKIAAVVFGFPSMRMMRWMMMMRRRIMMIKFFVVSFTIIIPRWKVEDDEDEGPSAPPVEEDDDGERHDDYDCDFCDYDH